MECMSGRAELCSVHREVVMAASGAAIWQQRAAAERRGRSPWGAARGGAPETRGPHLARSAISRTGSRRAMVAGCGRRVCAGVERGAAGSDEASLLREVE